MNDIYMPTEELRVATWHFPNQQRVERLQRLWVTKTAHPKKLQWRNVPYYLMPTSVPYDAPFYEG